MTKKADQPYFSASDPKQAAATKKPLQAVAWTAPDSLKGNFSAGWYLKATLFFGAITVASVLWLDSLISAILFVVVYIALIIYTKHPAQITNYNLSEDGLFINDQVYNLADFASFGLIEDRDFFSVILLPNKRLATSLTLNFKKKDGEAIVDFLGAIMPMRQIEENLIDKIIRRLGL